MKYTIQFNSMPFNFISPKLLSSPGNCCRTLHLHFAWPHLLHYLVLLELLSPCARIFTLRRVFCDPHEQMCWNAGKSRFTLPELSFVSHPQVASGRGSFASFARDIRCLLFLSVQSVSSRYERFLELSCRKTGLRAYMHYIFNESINQSI